MPSSPALLNNAASPLQSGLSQFARICATGLLLVAPFHASAGWRGGFLLLAALSITVLCVQRRSVAGLLPENRWLIAVLAWWMLATLAWSLAFPPNNWGEWKRDVLTPVLALPVFFFLTESRRDLARWLEVLTVGLILLTVFLLCDPTDANEGMRQPWYGGAGSLSTWLVGMAAMLPWMAAEAKQNRRMRLILLINLLLIPFCAYFTLNRTVWGCFAMMLCLYSLGTMVPPHTPRVRWFSALLTILIGIGLFAVLAHSSVQKRFDQDLVAQAENDPRAHIWQQSTAVIADHYATGLGFGISTLRERLITAMPDKYIAEHYGHGHNLVLNYLLQMGVAGALTLLALFAVLLWTFVTIRQRGGIRELAGICGLLLVSGMFLRNMTDDFFNRHNALQFWALAGILLAMARWQDIKNAGENEQQTHPHSAP